jgi:hypothetical protein
MRLYFAYPVHGLHPPLQRLIMIGMQLMAIRASAMIVNELRRYEEWEYSLP